MLSSWPMCLPRPKFRDCEPAGLGPDGLELVGIGLNLRAEEADSNKSGVVASPALRESSAVKAGRGPNACGHFLHEPSAAAETATSPRGEVTKHALLIRYSASRSRAQPAAMTAEQASVSPASLLEELETRQDELLQQLDELNLRIELLLSQWSIVRENSAA